MRHWHLVDGILIHHFDQGVDVANSNGLANAGFRQGHGRWLCLEIWHTTDGKAEKVIQEINNSQLEIWSMDPKLFEQFRISVALTSVNHWLCMAKTIFCHLVNEHFWRRCFRPFFPTVVQWSTPDLQFFLNSNYIASPSSFGFGPFRPADSTLHKSHEYSLDHTVYNSKWDQFHKMFPPSGTSYILPMKMRDFRCTSSAGNLLPC